jgi:hypothetical protein
MRETTVALVDCPPIADESAYRRGRLAVRVSLPFNTPEACGHLDGPMSHAFYGECHYEKCFALEVAIAREALHDFLF